MGKNKGRLRPKRSIRVGFDKERREKCHRKREQPVPRPKDKVICP